MWDPDKGRGYSSDPYGRAPARDYTPAERDRQVLHDDWVWDGLRPPYWQEGRLQKRLAELLEGDDLFRSIRAKLPPVNPATGCVRPLERDDPSWMAAQFACLPKRGSRGHLHVIAPLLRGRVFVAGRERPMDDYQCRDLVLFTAGEIIADRRAVEAARP